MRHPRLPPWPGALRSARATQRLIETNVNERGCRYRHSACFDKSSTGSRRAKYFKIIFNNFSLFLFLTLSNHIRIILIISFSEPVSLSTPAYMKSSNFVFICIRRGQNVFFPSTLYFPPHFNNTINQNSFSDGGRIILGLSGVGGFALSGVCVPPTASPPPLFFSSHFWWSFVCAPSSRDAQPALVIGPDKGWTTIP